MNRKMKAAFLSGMAAAGAGLLLESEHERRTPVCVFYHVRSEKILSGDRTLVFLSDQHNAVFGRHNEKLLSMIGSVSPDAVLIGGDMMNVKKKADIRPALDFCESLTERYPVYYGNGNHETRLDRGRERYGDLYDEFHEALCSMGVRHLSNASAMLDDDIRITGLDITENYYRNIVCDQMEPAYIESRVGPASQDCFQILLAHSPLFLSAYAGWGADLTLSGHFHGGTVRLPGDIGLMTPQFQFFSRLVTGMKEKDGSKLIISAGTGTHTVNIRLHNKPQVVVVKLTH